MIIIFEGADHSGKTTIAKALSKVLGYEYFKHSTQQDDFKLLQRQKPIIEAEFFVNLMSQVSLNLIVDRHIPSEYVYSRIFKRDFDLSEIVQIDRQLASLNAVMIYCEKKINKKYEDALVPAASYSEILNAYHDYLSITAIPYLYLDTANENLKIQLNIIRRWL